MEVQTEINDLKANLNFIEVQIKTKETEITELQKANIKNLESLNLKDKPPCIQKQEGGLHSISEEISGLTDLRHDLQRKLEEKENELRLGGLREQAKVFKSSEQTFFSLANKAGEELDKLNGQVENLRDIVEEMAVMKLPPETLGNLVRELDNNVSLRSFFETGEAMSDSADNSVWKKEVEKKYHNLLNRLPKLDQDMHRLRESLRVRFNTALDLVRSIR